MSMGTGGNTIAGAVGGIAGGSLLTSLIPMLSGGAGGVDIGALVGQIVGGGVSGAIVTAIVGGRHEHVQGAERFGPETRLCSRSRWRDGERRYMGSRRAAAEASLIESRWPAAGERRWD